VIISDVVQGSLEWHKKRQGVLTGSKLKGLYGIGTARQTLLKTLVSQRMTEVDLDNYCGKKMEWGNTWEPKAVEMASEYRGVNFETCGMMVSEEVGNFALSPDGVYYENSQVVGGVECKAPDPHTHVGYLLADEVPKEYKWQVYGNFMMSDKIKWWDFVSIDPRNYSRPLFIIRTHRKDIDKEIKEAKSKLVAFLKDVDSAHLGLIF